TGRARGAPARERSGAWSPEATEPGMGRSPTKKSEEKMKMKNLFARFVREDEGQDIIEYALLAAFISIVAWLVLQSIGQDVQQIYSNVQQATGDAVSSGGGGS